MKKSTRAFTLIELLIVIGIIGSIIIMGINNYSAVQRKTRDTRRKSDVKQIQKALELFLQDQNSPAYPVDGAIPAPGSPWSSAGGNTYMNSVPGDPNRTPVPQRYFYTRTSNLVYRLCACLENAADIDGTGGSCDISYACTSGKKYELTQP